MAKKAAHKKAAKKAAPAAPVKANRTAPKKSTGGTVLKLAAPVKANRTAPKKSTGGKVLKLAAPVKANRTAPKNNRRPNVAHLLCVLDMLTNYTDVTASVLHIVGGPYLAKVMGPQTSRTVQIVEFTTYKKAKNYVLDFVKDVENISDLRAKDMLNLEYQNAHSINAIFAEQRGENQPANDNENKPETATFTDVNGNQKELEKGNLPQIDATQWRERLPEGTQQVVCTPIALSYDAANREVCYSKVEVDGLLYGYEVTVNGVCVLFTPDAEKAGIEFNERLEHAGQ